MGPVVGLALNAAVPMPPCRHASSRVMGPCGRRASGSSTPCTRAGSPVSRVAITEDASELDARLFVKVVPALASFDSSGAACGPPHGARDLAPVLPRTTTMALRAAGAAASGLDSAPPARGSPRDH